MFNIHTPERQPFETQAQYRERQALSKLAVRSITVFLGGKQSGRQIQRARRHASEPLTTGAGNRNPSHSKTGPGRFHSHRRESTSNARRAQ